MKKNQKKPILAIVVPCYNEEAVLAETSKQLWHVLDKLAKGDKIDKTSFILFVDDGSRDETWPIIQNLNLRNSQITGLKLAHNVGHQNALLAGLLQARNKGVDCVISIDADLQDDVGVIEEFVESYKEGFEIVYGVRQARKTDTFFKRSTALFFYRLMKVMKVEIVYNHADYRLIGNKALAALSQYGEVNLFLRGIFPQMGFKTTFVYYDRKERFAGESKYPLRKMLSFAFDGITSFSIKPLRIVTTLGFALFTVSLTMTLYILYETLIANKTVPGWASTVLPIYFIGGIQILCLGIIGEYIGKVYKETKERPRFIIDEETGDETAR